MSQPVFHRGDAMVRWPRAMAARTDDIIAFLDDLLEVERFADYGKSVV